MKFRKHKIIKLISALLITALLWQDIVSAEGLSFLGQKGNLQPQCFTNTINPALQHENFLKGSLEYILRSVVVDIEKNNRRIFDNSLIPGLGFVFDFREDQEDSTRGKRREGDNWIISCAIGLSDEIQNDHKYKWYYEAVVNADNEVSIKRINKRSEKTEHKSVSEQTFKPKETRKMFFESLLRNGWTLTVKDAQSFLSAAGSWDEELAREWSVTPDILGQVKKLRTYSYSTIYRDLETLDVAGIKKIGVRNYYYADDLFETVEQADLAIRDIEFLRKDKLTTKEFKQPSVSIPEHDIVAPGEETNLSGTDVVPQRNVNGFDESDTEEDPETVPENPNLEISPILINLLRTATSVMGWDKPSYRTGQIEAIDKLKEGNPVELRTGGGKTLTLVGAALMRYVEKGEKTLVLTHEDALTEQAMLKDKIGEILSKMGVVTGFILPDEKGEARGVIYRDGKSEQVEPQEIHRVYEESGIIYSKWDRIVHCYMAEKKGSTPKSLSKNKYFTLFDEADLMLVFGAATPAVISGSELSERDVRLDIRRRVDSFVVESLLTDENTYYVPKGTKEIYLSRSGESKSSEALAKIARLSDAHAAIVAAEGETYVLDALRARLFFREGEQYFLAKDSAGETLGVIVRDEQTGAPKGTVTRDANTGVIDRNGMSFGEGLQQAVEIMAGVPSEAVSPETNTAMSMTIVQFLNDRDIVTDFAGASGTMETERFESIYGKKVESIEGATATLISMGHTGFNTAEEKRQGLLERMRARIGNGQPMFIKVESDAETEELRSFIETNLADELAENGIIINIADGRDSAEFSAMIAVAGYSNVITIVTNLAHRGIDIEIKGTRLNPDGTEGEEVDLIDGKMPGLHVISTYLDEADAFEIQTKGRADRGKQEIQGSWEGIFSLDENIFTSHRELLDQPYTGLKDAVASGNAERTDRLIGEVRILIVSENNTSDKKKRKYEDEVFGYQAEMLNLFDITSTERNFRAFLKSRGAGVYEIMASRASSSEELAESLNALREKIRAKTEEGLERFQTEQQRTRNRINYLASLSQLGVRGAFTQMNQEIISAIRLVRNKRAKVKDIRAFMQAQIAVEMQGGVAGVRPSKAKRASETGSTTITMFISVIAVVGMAAFISFLGIQPLIAYVLNPVMVFLALYPVITAVTAAALFIPTVFLRQAYSNKISHLDTSTVDFMRFTAGIGEGNGLKAFGKWAGTMILQLLAGPGLFAGAGTLVTAIAHPVILAGFAPIAVPAALISIALSLISNVVLVLVHRKGFKEMEHVRPNRFQHGMNVSVKTIAILVGLFVAVQSGAGALVATGGAVGAIFVSSIVSGIFAWKAGGRFYEAKTPAVIGALAGAILTGGLVTLASYIGAGAIFTSALSLLKITIGIMGVGMVVLQTMQAIRLGRDAGRDGQSPVRAALESFLPNTRSILMYATAIPAVIFNFTGLVPTAMFIASITVVIMFIYIYSVNIERSMGRPFSRTTTKAMGGTVMAAAGITPMVVFPERAYAAQQDQINMRNALIETGALDEAQTKALENIRTYSGEELAGFKVLGQNLENAMAEVIAGTFDFSEEEPSASSYPTIPYGSDITTDVETVTPDEIPAHDEAEPVNEIPPAGVDTDVKDADMGVTEDIIVPSEAYLRRLKGKQEELDILKTQPREIESLTENYPMVEGTSSDEVQRTVEELEEVFDTPVSGAVIPAGPNLQNIFEGSPLAVTLIATHMENMAPMGLPRQTRETDKSKQDPVDFIHLRNISGGTINLSDYGVSDSSGKKRTLRDYSGGREVYLRSGQEIRIIFSGKDIAEEVHRRLARTMIIIPDSLSKKGETVTVYSTEGRAIAVATSGPLEGSDTEIKQDEVTTFRIVTKVGIPRAEGSLVVADPIPLSTVLHDIGSFDLESGKLPDTDKPEAIRDGGTGVDNPEKDFVISGTAPRAIPDSEQVDESRSMISKPARPAEGVHPPRAIPSRELVSYENAEKEYNRLTNWRGVVSKEEGVVDTLKLAIRSVLEEIADGRIKTSWHGFGKQNLPWKIYRSLEFTLGEKAMREDPEMVLLARAMKQKMNLEALRKTLEEYDSLSLKAEDFFAGGLSGKKSIADILAVVMRDGYQIRQSGHRLEEARAFRELADSGRLFWDLELSYGINGTSGSAALQTAQENARETAVKLAETERELAEDRLALRNDQLQLAEAQTELVEDLAANENDQRQLAEARQELVEDMAALENDRQQLAQAIEEGDEERISRERAEIEQKLIAVSNSQARIEQETLEIADNEEEIRNGYSRIESERAEIADDQEEIARGEEKRQRQKEELNRYMDRIRRLREPELRLRSTLGAVLFDSNRYRDTKSAAATERERRIDVELTKIELFDRVVQLYVDIITAERSIETLTEYLTSLEALREKSTNFNFSAEDLVTMDMQITRAKSDLAAQKKIVLDGKAELRYIIGVPGDVSFEIDDTEYDPVRIASLLTSSGVDMEQYLALVLAKKSEEIVAYYARVPSGIFKHFDINIRAVWEEDIFRRVLYDNLRDPIFMGVRAGALFGDPSSAKENRENLLLYLKSIDEYKLIERMQYTMAARSGDMIETLNEGRREQEMIAAKAQRQIDGFMARRDAGLGNLRDLLRAMEEAKTARMQMEFSESLLLRAEVARAKSQGTTLMELAKYDDDAIEKIIDLMKAYRKAYRDEKFETAERTWTNVRRCLPGLIMPMSERQIDKYLEEVENFKDNMEDMTATKKKSTDDLSVYIQYNLSVEQRRELASLIKEFEEGRGTLGNFLKGRVKSDEEMGRIVDRVIAILPLIRIPTDVDFDDRKKMLHCEIPVITSALDMAAYSIEGSSIVDMFLVACERGRLGPAEKDVEIARNMARDDVKVFRPIVSIGGKIGVGGDIAALGDITTQSFLGNSEMNISLSIPLNNPGKREKRESGKEFILSSLIKFKLAERDLQVGIARQLVTMHSLMEQYENLGAEAKNYDERIELLKKNPRATRMAAERLERERQAILLRQKYTVLELKVAKNNLRDILGLEYSDIVLIDDITNEDIEKMLDTLKESMEGNFVISSTVDMVDEGTMVTIGPNNELAANNVPTGLTVYGKREIKVVAIRDLKGQYIGQIALDKGVVISSDIKAIPEESRVAINASGEMSITRRGRAVDASGVRAGDMAPRYIVSVIDPNRQRAGEVLIDYRTGDEGLRMGIHRAERRGYALSAVAIKKEGNQMSLELSVSPFSLAGCPIATVSPKLPDTWLDWKGLGWFNLPGFLTGARARQKEREVLSGFASQESRRHDLMMQKAEQFAEKQKESAVKLYRLAARRAALANSGIKGCEDQIQLLIAELDNLRVPSVIDRFKTQRVRLERSRDDAENNLAVMRILLSLLGLEESEVRDPADEARVINFAEARSMIGQRTEDEIARVDIEIAKEMQRLASFASMFGQETTGLARFYEDNAGKDNNVLPGVTLSLSFTPRINQGKIAELEVEDKIILAGISIDNARQRIIQLYGAYAEASMRVATQKTRIMTLSALPGAEDKEKGAETRSGYDLEAARIQLAHAKMAQIEAEQAISLGMSELVILLQTKTGVVIDLSYLTDRLGTYPDADVLEERFEDVDTDMDKTIQHFRNRLKKAELEESQAVWDILPTFRTEISSWNEIGSSPSYIVSASTRILGSGRAIRARLARIEQERRKDSEANRVREIRYEWDLIDNELVTAMEEAKKIETAIAGIGERMDYILARKIADHAAGGRTTVRDIDRLVAEYEDLKYRYFQTNIRMNIAYAMGVNMLNNLVGIDGTTEALAGLEPPAPAPPKARPVKPAFEPEKKEIPGALADPGETGDTTWEIKTPPRDDAPPADPELILPFDEELPGLRDFDELVPASSFFVPAGSPERDVAAERAPPPEEPLSPRIDPALAPGEEVKGPAEGITTTETTEFEDVAYSGRLEGLAEIGVVMFDELTRDIGLMFEDFSGRNDPDKNGISVVCDINQIIGNGRYVIERIRPEGEMVKKGDWLVQFDSSVLEAERDKQEKLANETRRDVILSSETIAEAEKQKRAILVRFRADKRVAEAKMVAGESMLERAGERIKIAEENIALSEKYLARIKSLRDIGVASEFDYKQAMLLKHQAIEIKIRAGAEMARARRMMEEARAEIRLHETVFRQETVIRDTTIERATSDMNAAEQTLKLQLERLKLLTESIEKCTIYAQRDGMVIHSNVTGIYFLTVPIEPVDETIICPGFSVANGQEVMRIVDPDSLLFVPKPPMKSPSETVIKADIRTGYGSQLGSVGVPIRSIVEEGTVVNEGDVIAQFDDSVLQDLVRLEEEKLQESRRLIAEAESLLAVAEKSRSNYLENEYPALVKNARITLAEARAIHEARKRDVLIAVRNVGLLKERLEMVMKLAARGAAVTSEVDAIRIEYNAAIIAESEARSQMELAGYLESAAEVTSDTTPFTGTAFSLSTYLASDRIISLERILSEHETRLAAFDRKINISRERLKLAIRDEEIDLERIKFFQTQIANCTVRATRSGILFCVNNQRMMFAGTNIKPVQKEIIIGEGAIVPVGVPFIKISERAEEETPEPVLAERLNAYLDSKAPESEEDREGVESIVCEIKPLRLYNIVGYGATIKYVAEDGKYVEVGERIVEFDSSAFESERDLQLQRINDTRLAANRAAEIGAEAEQQKKAVLAQHEEVRKAVLAKKQVAERMLAEAREKQRRADANIVLAKRSIARLDQLVKKDAASFADQLEALLRLNEAERIKDEAYIQAAEARRMLGEAESELKVLEEERDKEIRRLDGVIERAVSAARAAREKIRLQRVRLELIEANIKNCVIYAEKSGRVSHHNQSGITAFGIPVASVPRDVTIGPRLTIGYGQKVLSLDTTATQTEADKKAQTTPAETLVEADISTAYDSGGGVIYPAIKKLHVPDGGYVEKGQILVEFESSVLEMMKREEELRLHESMRLAAEAASLLDEAKRRERVHTGTEYPALIAQAEALLSQSKKDYEARKATRESAEKIVALRRLVLDIAIKVLGRNAALVDEVEVLQFIYNIAAMEKNIAAYEEALALSAVRFAEAKLARIKHEHEITLVTLQREINTAVAAYRLAKERETSIFDRVKFYEEQIANCVIKAEESGTVSYMHSLPLIFLGVTMKRVPVERIVSEGATMGPGPFIRITHGPRPSAESAAEAIKPELYARTRVPEGATPVTCEIEPVTFGRRGEHGAMVLEIAPEGGVKKGDLLVRVDTSAQQRLMVELQKLINDYRMISLDSTRSLESYEDQKKIHQAKLVILKIIQDAMVKGGDDMAENARELQKLAEENITISDKRVERAAILLKKMVLSRMDYYLVNVSGEESDIMRDRAIRELAAAILVREEGANVFEVIKGQTEQELALLDGLIQRARINRESAVTSIKMYTEKVHIIMRNKEKAAIYAQEDGWITYTHDVGQAFAGIPITYAANPVYIGTGCVVKNGQSVMHFFAERPATIPEETTASEDKGVPVISNVRNGENDWMGPVGARILEISRKTGDFVKKGEVILGLDPSELQDFRKQAEIQLIEARRLVREYAALRAEAEENLNEFLKNEYPAMLERAKARIEGAKGMVEDAKQREANARRMAEIKEEEYRALVKFQKLRAAAQEEVDIANAEWNTSLIVVERAEYELDSAIMTLAEAEETLRVIEQDRLVRETVLRGEVEVYKGKETVASENIRLGEETIAFYDAQIEACVIRAPKAGIVKYNDEVSYTFFVDRWVPRDVIIAVGYDVSPGITVAHITNPLSESAREPLEFSKSPIGLIAFVILMAGIVRTILRDLRYAFGFKKHKDPRHIGDPDKEFKKGAVPTEEEGAEEVAEDAARDASRDAAEPAEREGRPGDDASAARVSDEGTARPDTDERDDDTFVRDPEVIADPDAAEEGATGDSKEESETLTAATDDTKVAADGEEAADAGAEAERTEDARQESPDKKNSEISDEDKDKPSDDGKKRGGMGPILGAILLTFLLPLMGCIQAVIPTAGAESSKSFLGPGFSWFSTLAQTYPAINILAFLVGTAMIMIMISYLLVMGRDNKKESVARLETFARRPGIFLTLALSLAIMTAFVGLPSVASWGQAIEVAKIVGTAVVFVTYPLSIAGVFLIGFIRNEIILRFRVMVPTGIIKLRHNSVLMAISEGTKRLFKWWAMIGGITATLHFVMPHIVPVPVTAGPSLTFNYIFGWITHLYGEVAAIHPYVNIVRWAVVVLVTASFIEVFFKKVIHLLRDDSHVVIRVISKILILGIAGGFLYMASPFLPAFMAFPFGVTFQHVLQSSEVAVIVATMVGFYFLICSYIMGMFYPRINRIYQAPPLLNLIIARFRSNAPRLVALRRLAIFIVSMLFIEYALVSASSAPFILQAREWYEAFALQHPGIIVGAWLSFTLLAAVISESALNIVLKIFPAMKRKPGERVIKVLSFAGAAAMVSMFFISFPSIAAWSQVISWVGIIMLGTAVIGLPIQITGAFMLGIKARVLHIRAIVPFLAHVKTRIRDIESYQSDAIFKLLKIWKGLITAVTILLYAAPLIFTPAALVGEVHNPLLRFIYAKAVKWAVYLSTQYPFVNVIFWGSVVMLVAAIVEVAIRKSVPSKTGDEYMINRLAGKIPALLITAVVAIMLGPLSPQLKAIGSAVGLAGIVVFSLIEIVLGITFNGKSARIRKFLQGTALVFMTVGLLALVPAFPGSAAWASFWPAAEIGALVLAGVAVYLMVAGYILGIFVPRINQVLQPLFTFFFIVTRWRSENPPLKIVNRFFGLAIIMTSLAYIFATQALVHAVVLGSGVMLLMSAAVFKEFKLKRAFKEAKTADHRREEKFELENINNEPREARDMMEAMGMVGDKFNPTKSYYYNHSLYLDTPGYRWKGMGYFLRHPFSEIEKIYTRHPQLLTYFARENSYRTYRYKARIRWYGDRELIKKIDGVESTPGMSAQKFIDGVKAAILADENFAGRFESVLSNLPEAVETYTADTMRVKLLELAGQTEADKGKVHLEIKNRLDTRMWKFETGAWEWAVPHILALADGGGTVSINGYDYVLRKTDETEDFFKVGREKPKAVLFRVDRNTGEKIMAKSMEATSAGYRAVIDGMEINFTESDIDKEINYDWLPDVYQGQDCRMDRTSQSGLEEFCAYVRRYTLVPTVQVSYERLEYVSASGKKEKLLERLVPLALEYRKRINTGAPETAYWKGILRSPAGKYLRAILASKNPENPDIKIDPKDFEYLRMTIDMNVRCIPCDDLHNPTLFTGLQGFKRIWPNRTILEVKYRGKKAPQWVYDMVEELDRRRETKTINDRPIRRQPAGKYCDSVTVWLYDKFLRGDFRIRSLGQKWAGFKGKQFNEVFDIDPENPYIEPYGLPPMNYGVLKRSMSIPVVDSASDVDHSGAMIPMLTRVLSKARVKLKLQSWIEQAVFGAGNAFLLYLAGEGNAGITGFVMTGLVWAVFYIAYYLHWFGIKTTHSPPKKPGVIFIGSLNLLSFLFYASHPLIFLAGFSVATVTHFLLNLSNIKAISKADQAIKDESTVEEEVPAPGTTLETIEEKERGEEPGTHNKDIYAVKENQVTPLSDKASLERRGVYYRLLEASGDEDLANAFADGIFSMYRQKREIVFAFDKYLGGCQGTKAMRILEAIDKLKREYPDSEFLQNISNLVFDPSHKSGSLQEKVDSEVLVLMFAREGIEFHKELKNRFNKPNVRITYINEEKISDMLGPDGKIYYPLFEIVTLVFANSIEQASIEEIQQIGKKIALMPRKEGNALVFTILPSVKRFDTKRELLDYYIIKRKLLESA